MGRDMLKRRDAPGRVPSPLADRLLQEHRIVSIDTGIFIYFVEQHPRYYPFCEFLFKNIEVGHIRASTSTLSLLEILVQPYKLKKDELVLKFYSLLTTYPNLSWIELSINIADLAARLRGKYNLKTPDSIQVASAVSSGATGFICNDRAFKKVKEIECIVIDDYLSAK